MQTQIEIDLWKVNSLKMNMKDFNLLLSEDKPNRVTLELNIPNEVRDAEDLNRWFRKEFGFNVDYDEEYDEERNEYDRSEYYGCLFYNSSLRSLMGYLFDDSDLLSIGSLESINICIDTHAYVIGYENEWEKLLRNSTKWIKEL